MRKIPMFDHDNLPEKEPVKGFWKCVRAHDTAVGSQAPCPVFSDVIWEDEIENIVKTMRKAGVKKIAITYGGSGWLDVLATLQEYGCSLGKITQIADGRTDWDRESQKQVLRKVNGLIVKL